MQSGISASQELHAAFNDLVSTAPAKRGLLAGIEGEALVPLDTIAAGGGDFLSDVASLPALLSDTAAAYIILHRHQEEGDGFVAVTYVPDAAPVRQKMLFAATRLTLVRELGAERFRDTLFATTREELSAEGWKRHDRHGQVAAPLTAEERTLQDVKEAEAEASRSTGARRNLVQGAHGAAVADQAMAAAKELAGAQWNLLKMRSNVQTETVELVGTASISLDELPAALSTTEPGYTFFRYAHTHEGQELAPVIFVSSCPSGLKVKERMFHASSKNHFLASVKDAAGLDVDKKIEVGDPSELTPSAIHDELHPKVEQKAGFSRPKRPGRK